MHRLLLNAVLASSAVGICSIALGQQSEQLLGLPFGDTLKISACPKKFWDAKKPCWVGKPFFYKPDGSLTGAVAVPEGESKKRPLWAAHGTFNLTLDKEGKVQKIEIRTSAPNEADEIVKSVSKRFGAPLSNYVTPHGQLAKWSSPTQGGVEMFCHDEACITTFRTAKNQKELDAELAARAKSDAVRPDAP